MFTRLASLAQRSFPIEMRLVAVAVAIGLLAGAFYLGESPELATAVGIAVGFSCAVGSWLGIRLYLAADRLFIVWIDAIRKRAADVRKEVADLEPRLMAAEGHGSTGGRKNQRRPLVMPIVLISVYATPVCFAVVTAGAIGSILSTQLGPSFVAMLLTATLSGLGALALVVAVQSWYLWRVQRRVATLQRYLTQVRPVLPEALPAEVLDSNISRTERIVRRLTGIGQTAAEQTTA